MTIKSDKWIRAWRSEHKMIEPFEAGQVKEAGGAQKIVSYGTSSYGYDIRCSTENSRSSPRQLDHHRPQALRREELRRLQGSTCASSRPNPFRLARTSSTSAVPRTCSPSAWASPPTRAAGIIVNVTPLEPEWRGT